jgi:hypothetical protein
VFSNKGIFKRVYRYSSLFNEQRCPAAEFFLEKTKSLKELGGTAG